MGKLLFDLLPVLLFFVAYKAANLYVATAVAIVASLAQIAWLRLRGRPVEGMQWAGLGIIVVFGGMTLLFQDETFIKWKPTVLYALFCAVLLGARYGLRRNLIRLAMEKTVQVPPPVWDRLNLAWAAFFAAMAGLNLWVAYGFSTEVWVNFKLFGTLGLTLAFVVAQALYMGRHVIEPPADR